ncbi:MAG: 2-oxoglutarate dehydrogenase E1 component [Aggregatilineales bacterium]
MAHRDFYGPNEGYVLDLYERYRRDPQTVDPAVQAFFAHWSPMDDGHATNGLSASARAAPAMPLEAIAGVVNYAQAIRSFGHLAAQLDPLGSSPPGDPALKPEAHGITETDLAQLPASLVGGPISEHAPNALEAIHALQSIYSGALGYDYDHIREPHERAWLREAAESGRFRPTLDNKAVRSLLERLTQVEAFELFLHRLFPGKYRFSIEGLDIMVPVLDTVIGAAAQTGIGAILIGMAHRGRLNVLAHTLAKDYRQILAEFKDPLNINLYRRDLSWTGDVKYHAGANRELRELSIGGQTLTVEIRMAPNPSHLEAVNPVVEGMARAAGTKVEQPGEPRFNPAVTLPIVIHGDAAFPGQGVVAETLNMQQLPGYWTGGTIHVIANNQLGFTTLPVDGRSTLYASDLAKGFKIPVVHVNADDPEACLEAAQLAFAYRAQFQKDFLIDLIGYRRYGHNEVDEPGFTQPTIYKVVQSHPTVRALWAKTLTERGQITVADAEDMVRRRMEELQKVSDTLNPERDLIVEQPKPSPPGAAKRIPTAVPLDRLRILNDALLTDPPNFTFNSKLLKARQRRREVLTDPDKPTIEWATAEELAFASILEDGTAIRLTGQDVERGTFSQRHAVFFDAQTGESFVPLQNLPNARAAFEIRNSPLSENAALGFEYGYNVQSPERLVLWEAQYGDFDNGAQVIIDEFVMSARAKWGQTPSLVMLLPHGLEGSGPDHASARLERFLQLCAETNARIANCTTAAQYFHLLRRQAGLLIEDPLPLIIMTPKSLLRHPLVASPARDLTVGHWQPVIDDSRAHANAGGINRALLCSGKIYIDLVSNPLREESTDTALIRVEQLYLFPEAELARILGGYPALTEIVWVQEEPQNMGAWDFVEPYLAKISGGKCPVRYVGRAPGSSPAEGSPAWHNAVQDTIIKRAYGKTEKSAVESLIAVT